MYLLTFGTMCSKLLVVNSLGTIQSIHGIYSYLINSTHTNITDFLEQIDIKEKIVILEVLLEEFKNKDNKKSVKIAVGSIGHCIQDINKNMTELKERIEYHNTVYFNYWRTMYCDDLIEKIKKNNLLLDQRIDLLTKIYNIN